MDKNWIESTIKARTPGATVSCNVARNEIFFFFGGGGGGGGGASHDAIFALKVALFITVINALTKLLLLLAFFFGIYSQKKGIVFSHANVC